MTTKDGFILYKSFYTPIEHLSKEKKGDLLDALFRYQINGSAEVEDPDVKMAFAFFKNQFDIDQRKYEETCRRRSGANGGGRPRQSEEPIQAKEIKVEQENGFEDFWECYHDITGLPKTDKDAAFKHWKKLTKKEQGLAKERIEAYFESLSNSKYCKKARTYLADKNFNDEFESPRGFIVPR